VSSRNNCVKHWFRSATRIRGRALRVKNDFPLAALPDWRKKDEDGLGRST
jgi:hypothetical protein